MDLWERNVVPFTQSSVIASEMQAFKLNTLESILPKF